MNKKARSAPTGTGVAARRTDALLKEYARLSAVQNDHIKSSFNDFKMLSAASGILGFVITAATFLTKGRKGPDVVTGDELALLAFIAFLGLLALVAVLGFRDLLKQSVITGLTVHLGALEMTLRDRMHLRGTTALLTNATSRRWFTLQHRRIAGALHIVFYVAVGAIPCGVLIAVDALVFAGAHAGITLALLVAHAFVAEKLLLRFSPEELVLEAKKLKLLDEPQPVSTVASVVTSSLPTPPPG
jgi:hypothetical protein